MDDELVAHALSPDLNDLRVCDWVTAEVDRSLNRMGPQDPEFWQTYTAVINGFSTLSGQRMRLTRSRRAT